MTIKPRNGLAFPGASFAVFFSFCREALQYSRSGAHFLLIHTFTCQLLVISSSHNQLAGLSAHSVTRMVGPFSCPAGQNYGALTSQIRMARLPFPFWSNSMTSTSTDTPEQSWMVEQKPHGAWSLMVSRHHVWPWPQFPSSVFNPDGLELTSTDKSSLEGIVYRLTDTQDL